jgi:hypothetical protein
MNDLLGGGPHQAPARPGLEVWRWVPGGLQVPSALCQSNRWTHTFSTTCIGEPAFSKSGHETDEGREASHKPLYILDTPNLPHFRDGWDLFGVCFDAVHGDAIPQELAPGDPKGALFQFNLIFKRMRLAKVSSRLVIRLLLCRDFMMMSST